MGTSIYSTIRFGTGSVRTGIALCFPFLLLYRLGLPSAFRSEYYTGLGLLSCFLFKVLYKFGTVFFIEYYTGFGLVLSQVGNVPQLYLSPLVLQCTRWSLYCRGCTLCLKVLVQLQGPPLCHATGSMYEQNLYCVSLSPTRIVPKCL